MANVNLDDIDAPTFTILGGQYTVGDLNVQRQDAMFALDAELEKFDTSDPERVEGESDEDYADRKRNQQRAVSKSSGHAIIRFIVAMLDNPGDLEGRLIEAYDTGKYGLKRLRLAQDTITDYYGAESEAQGND